MEIVLIAAIGSERQLGLDNQLLWHLPGDLPRFKAMTMGFPIVMGRKTFDSIGKALPGRTNIVLSRNSTLSLPDVKLANTVNEAIEMAQFEQAKKLFVIGGGEIYSLFLPTADALELTLVEDSPQADAYFPDFLSSSEYEFKEVSRESLQAENLHYHYVRYEKTIND